MKPLAVLACLALVTLASCGNAPASPPPLSPTVCGRLRAQADTFDIARLAYVRACIAPLLPAPVPPSRRPHQPQPERIG